MTKLVFIHSLNNYSGSPKVLSVLVRQFVVRGYSVELITSGGAGFLSGIRGVKYTDNWYRWQGCKLLTVLFLVISQLRVFCLVLFRPRRNTIYYLNTVTTFGAALACRMSGKRFVYHIHENMCQRKPLYAFVSVTVKAFLFPVICNPYPSGLETVRLSITDWITNFVPRLILIS